MQGQNIIWMALLLLALATLGCTGMNGYRSNAPGTPQMMGCDGDRVSGFPPYCQPGH